MILISSAHFSALWLFLTSQTASSSLKRFLEPSDIQEATGPFVDDVLYVDKTSHILRLIQREGRFFFLRPRGFGKSTLLRTLQGIFDGRGRTIFNYTHIHRSDYKWDAYPVLYIDLGNNVVENNEACEGLDKEPRSRTLLENKVDEIFVKFKTDYGLSKPKESHFSDEFASIVKEMKKNGNLTVVLVDEYDFSVLNNMNSCPTAAQINSELMREFFFQLNDVAGSIKLAFITGISKAVVSILFELDDLTHNMYFHDIAGLTESDLDKYHSDHLAEVSSNVGKPKDNITRELKRWYNGYQFSRSAPALYNPSSVHSYFRKGEAKRYWRDEATTKFLFEQMMIRPFDFSLNLKYGTRSDLRGGLSLDKTDGASLLYDAGYLTIHDFKNGKFTLKFPNLEMEEAFNDDIAQAALFSKNSTRSEIILIASSLLETPVPSFCRFMDAINRGLMKLAIRPPFEEWYSWQTMLLMKKAHIPNVERETRLDISRENEYIDVTAYSDDIYFLIQCKLNEIGKSDAWAATRESIPAFLKQNINKTKPLMLLAAGITFSLTSRKNVVSAYQAKLIFPNGTVFCVYDSQDVPNKRTDFYRENSYGDSKITFERIKRTYKKGNGSTTKRDGSTYLMKQEKRNPT